MRDFITIGSSHGFLYADAATGEALAFECDNCEDCQNSVWPHIRFFDLDECRLWWEKAGFPIPSETRHYDILDLGYTYTLPGEGECMEPPVIDWREQQVEFMRRNPEWRWRNTAPPRPAREGEKVVSWERPSEEVREPVTVQVKEIM